ncbi:MAG: hypothetical protein RL219_834 [Actinomycetota bacterium]
MDPDRERLHALGYAQELDRGLGRFSNFAISFSIISVLSGGLTSYWLGMVTGGARIITIGWLVVGAFSLLVGMALAEICSAYPTAAGLYFWSARLARRNGPCWAWFTGWFNLVGQVGCIASVDYALAVFIGYFVRSYAPDFRLTVWTVFVIYLLVLVSHGVLNTFGVRLVRVLGDISVWWHVLGVIVVFVCIAASSRGDQRGWAHLFDGEAGVLAGWGGRGFTVIYMFCLGLLLPQYTITGFDASAHVSEETVGAARSAPIGMVRAVYLSAIGGWVLNLAMTKALPRNPNAYAAVAFGGPGDAFLVNAAPRLFEAAVGPGLARFLVLISIVAQYFCGLASVTANSRMIYAFSRDRALPGSGLWSRINPRTRTPTNSVWLGVGLAAAVGAVSIYQRGGVSTAFFALTGITVIGLYISYAIPIFLRLRSTTFEPGPWNLRGRHRIVGWTSLAWVGFITVLFVGPLFRPFWPPFGITRLGGQTPGDPSDDVAVYHQNNMNFTGPIVVIAALGFALYWLLSARRWFEGPRSQGTPDELAAIEQRLTDGSEVGGSR